MSDFLTNLVTRSVGAAPVIQPRLPSLFEPAKPYMGSFAEASPRVEEVVREAGLETAVENADRLSVLPREGQAPVTKSGAERSASQDLLLPTAQPVRADESSRGRAARKPDGIPSQSKSAIPRENAPDVQPAPAQVPPDKKNALSPRSSEAANYDRRTAPVPAVSAQERNAAIGDLFAPAVLPKSTAEVPGQSAVQHSATGSEVPKSASRNLTPAKVDVPREFHQTAESHAQSPLVEPARSQDIAPRTPAAIAPASAPSFEFARHVPPAPRVSPPEQTIQVTIGRIEVRAVSQAATPKQRAASPVMSLNDYLQSRRGGA